MRILPGMGEHVVVTAGATRHTACGRLPLRGCVLAARAARPAWPASSMEHGFLHERHDSALDETC